MSNSFSYSRINSSRQKSVIRYISLSHLSLISLHIQSSYMFYKYNTTAAAILECSFGTYVFVFGFSKLVCELLWCFKNSSRLSLASISGKFCQNRRWYRRKSTIFFTKVYIESQNMAKIHENYHIISQDFEQILRIYWNDTVDRRFFRRFRKIDSRFNLELFSKVLSFVFLQSFYITNVYFFSNKHLEHDLQMST